MGLLESPIKNTNKSYQWISTQAEKLFGLVEICCKHTLLNAQMACLKMSFTENVVADLTGSSLSPGATTLDLSSLGCCAGFSIYAQTLPSSWQFPQLPFTVQDPWRFNSVFWSQTNTKQVGEKFQLFHFLQKKDVCGRFNIKGTAVLFCFLIFFPTGSINLRVGKNCTSLNHSSSTVKISSSHFSRI